MKERTALPSESHIIFSGEIPGVFAEETSRTRSYSMVSRHFHESLELYFLLEGQRFYFVDQDTYYMEEGMAILVNRNQIHKTSAANGKNHRRFLLQIDAQMLDGYLKQLGFSGAQEPGDQYWGVCRFTPEDWEEALAEIQKLERLFQEPDSVSRQRITLATLELLLLFIRNRKRNEEQKWKENPPVVVTGMHQKVHEIALFLQNNSGETFSLEWLAARFYISKSYLTRIFKMVTGFTIVEYQTFCRIQKAKTLLAETDFSITEIAGQTGFGNITYFERVFRKATDESPMRYRKKYRVRKIHTD